MAYIKKQNLESKKINGNDSNNILDDKNIIFDKKDADTITVNKEKSIDNDRTLSEN